MLDVLGPRRHKLHRRFHELVKPGLDLDGHETVVMNNFWSEDTSKSYVIVMIRFAIPS